MDWRNNYVDVSSCMLFETIGDSEDDSNVNHSDDIDGSSYQDTDLAEGDAFSCCCENEYNSDFDHPTGDYGNVHHVDQKEAEEEKGVCILGYQHDDEDEDEDAVDQVRDDADYKAGDIKFLKRNPDEWWEAEGGGVMMSEAGQRTKKLKVCGAEFLNEGDKDRHFWESCLAS